MVCAYGFLFAVVVATAAMSNLRFYPLPLLSKKMHAVVVVVPVENFQSGTANRKSEWKWDFPLSANLLRIRKASHKIEPKPIWNIIQNRENGIKDFLLLFCEMNLCRKAY